MPTGHSLGDAAGRILAIDPQVCEILQQREPELLGKTFRDFTHPDDLVRNGRLIETLRIGAGPIEFTKRYVRPDGSTVSVKIGLSRVSAAEGERLLGTIATLEPPVTKDVTSRWRAARRAADALHWRRAELGNDLFGDLAYALLIELYLTEVEGRAVLPGALSFQLAASPALVARWLTVLMRKGLVETVEDAPQLTAAGLRKIERLLDDGRMAIAS
jgi:PAS domain S-box-containing protein